MNINVIIIIWCALLNATPLLKSLSGPAYTVYTENIFTAQLLLVVYNHMVKLTPNMATRIEELFSLCKELYIPAIRQLLSLYRTLQCQLKERESATYLNICQGERKASPSSWTCRRTCGRIFCLAWKHARLSIMTVPIIVVVISESVSACTCLFVHWMYEDGRNLSVYREHPMPCLLK